ncbi:DNA helicase UvrD [Dissulfurirhabdus thermomarina]|uniref:DNA helicase UvrD n=1 Tax=Dissulfurirhabdus thermomarina TaxID=1765737 RepID=A0A6N9TMZ8_DISTH|nr:endonuclease Q family protein [Dissulfurirhabdus thermomarina]NDY41810.1 DNA helicase UvrD [Dissulfurirhabdus thermomarina]NMX24049.1 DNA helicase UvrD [Dissulfurirhabdus thermomarina]
MPAPTKARGGRPFPPWRRDVFLADFHIHSRFSRATSRRMTVPELDRWARLKGLALVGTGDFTHPGWLAELERELVPDGTGLYAWRGNPEGTRFVLTAEVANIFTQGGRNRRIHTVLFARDLEVARDIQARLRLLGNVASDGRPIFGFPVKRLVRLALEADPASFVLPAHVWTPWFSLFGAKSGFDALEDCFEEESGHIRALETGLSSDPGMNRRLSALDRYTLLSNSDAHSPEKLGREANVFSCPLGYDAVLAAIRDPDRGFEGTIEFFPEEGKYHHDGHRACGVELAPAATRRLGGRCPACGRPLTVGVLHRVEELADRPEPGTPDRDRPAVHLVPLEEIVAEALGVKSVTSRVRREYARLVALAGPEMEILLWRPLEELAAVVPERILLGIRRMRQGRVSIRPGHDGVYGRISLYGEEPAEEDDAGRPAQLPLF